MSRDHRGRHSSFSCPYTPDTGSERGGGGGGRCVRVREREREGEGEGGKGWYNVIQGVVCAENGMQTLYEYL